MKKLVIVVMAGLLLAAFALPAFAWEFSMTGEYEYRMRYWSRIGDKDLFGAMAGQDGPLSITTLPYTYQPTYFTGDPTATTWPQAFTVAGNQKVGLAGPNFYGTGQIVPANSMGANAPLAPLNSPTIISRGGLSDTGSDAIYADQKLTLIPSIRVNQAIRVHGTYNIGGVRNRFNQTASGAGVTPFERYTPVITTTGSTDTAAIGQWEQVRATITMPWAILSIGMKDFPFGIGLFSSYRTRGSSIVAVVPYGPFRFIPAFWHAHSSINALDTDSYRPDGANKSTWFGAMLVTYDSGPFNAGFGYITKVYHYNAASINAATPTAMGADNTLNVWAFSYKFNNGRFFSNAGYEWYTSNTTYLNPGWYPGTTAAYPLPGTQKPANYVEAYHLFAEVGVYAGPSKLSGMWAQVSGPVRNNWSRSDYSRGWTGQIGAQTTSPGYNPKTYDTWGIDWQVLDPYQYLMFGTYAGGNQSFGGLFLNDDGKGVMTDAFCFAGRLDYAVAANLNVWGSYMWAHRLEAASTYMGQYYSDGRDTLAPNFAKNTATVGGVATTDVGPTQRQNFRQNAGINSSLYQEFFVPDGFLGWEINLGCDWKLLENMTMKTRYAYWQPGQWFNFAYQALVPDPAISVTNRSNGYLGTRDAIQAFEGSFVIDF